MILNQLVLAEDPWPFCIVYLVKYSYKFINLFALAKAKFSKNRFLTVATLGRECSGLPSFLRVMRSIELNRFLSTSSYRLHLELSPRGQEIRYLQILLAGKNAKYANSFR